MFVDLFNSDSGILPVSLLSGAVARSLLTILAEQVEANPPVRGEEAPGTPPGLFVGPTLLGAPDSPEADGNVMDKVGADAPCVADEPEAETLPAGEPSPLLVNAQG